MDARILCRPASPQFVHDAILAGDAAIHSGLAGDLNLVVTNISWMRCKLGFYTFP
jgi:hypothetical protein